MCAEQSCKECTRYYLKADLNETVQLLLIHTFCCGRDTLEILSKISALFGFRLDFMFVFRFTFIFNPLHSFLLLRQIESFLYGWFIIQRQSLPVSSIWFHWRISLLRGEKNQIEWLGIPCTDARCGQMKINEFDRIYLRANSYWLQDPFRSFTFHGIQKVTHARGINRTKIVRISFEGYGILTLFKHTFVHSELNWGWILVKTID